MTLLEHLKSRRLDVSLYPSLVVDEDSYTTTFPLWNLSGKLVGMHTYKAKEAPNQGGNPREARYFTLIPTEANRATAFGVDLLDPKQRVVFLVEGVFDAAPLHARGVNALAVFGNNPKHLRSWLSTLNYTTVALVEGDKAGKKLANTADLAVYLPDGEDPGSMSDEWFDELVIHLT